MRKSSSSAFLTARGNHRIGKVDSSNLVCQYFCHTAAPFPACVTGVESACLKPQQLLGN